MKEWIEQKRKDILAQREIMRANMHACEGALQVLQELEAKLDAIKDGDQEAK